MKFKVFDKGTGLFLCPEVNGSPFHMTHDGFETYQFELKHPAFVQCDYAGKDMFGKDLFEGDIISSGKYHRGPILKDEDTGGFFVWNQAPFPCKIDASRFDTYELVGNSLDGTGPQTPIYEVDVVNAERQEEESKKKFLGLF